MQVAQFSEFAPPVVKEADRPFWSVMIPTYNREKDYLAQTLESVLTQDPGLEYMQIEVIDNCSTEGNPEALVKAIGKGRVNFYRQHKNVGAVQNANTCVSRSIGKWVHILHDDDIVLPGFYTKYEDLIKRFPDATLLTGPVNYIDENNSIIGSSDLLTLEDGIDENFLTSQALINRIQDPSVVIPRAVYEKIGGYDEAYFPWENWNLHFRAAAHGKAVCTITPYANYRMHENADMHNFIVNGECIPKALFTQNSLFDMLSAEEQRKLSSRRYYHLSELARVYALRLRGKHLHGSLVQATWALRLNPRPGNIRLYLSRLVKYLLKTPRQIFQKKFNS
jgi:glycosyltransferase involved in cell wall biosynthesis